MNEVERLSEDLWNILSDEEKLLLFCAVIRRLHVGELIEGRSYRGVLYDIFNFEDVSYWIAQEAGFLDLHNAIFRKQYLIILIQDLLKKHDIAISDDLIEQHLCSRNVKY